MGCSLFWPRVGESWSLLKVGTQEWAVRQLRARTHMCTGVAICPLVYKPLLVLGDRVSLVDVPVCEHWRFCMNELKGVRVSTRLRPFAHIWSPLYIVRLPTVHVRMTLAGLQPVNGI